MRLGRLILVVATLVTILVFPLVARDALQTVRSTSVYAQSAAIDPAGQANQKRDDGDN